jgi:hypothetical protein
LWWQYFEWWNPYSDMPVACLSGKKIISLFHAKGSIPQCLLVDHPAGLLYSL